MKYFIQNVYLREMSLVFDRTIFHISVSNGSFVIGNESKDKESIHKDDNLLFYTLQNIITKATNIPKAIYRTHRITTSSVSA
jgi:hypothetical protein